MNIKKYVSSHSSTLSMGISILFAVAMLLTAWIIDDRELSQQVTTFLIVAWFIPFFYLAKKMK